MSKGFIKYETRELEFLTIKTAQTTRRLPSCYVYLPKKFKGRKVIIAVPKEEEKGGDKNE